jgi:hypothetical protein
MRSAVAVADEIVSTKLRLALLREVDRLPLEEVSDAPPPKGGPSARQVVAECIDTLRRTLFAAEDKRTGSLPGRVPGTLSGTLIQAPSAAPDEATPNAPWGDAGEVPHPQHASHHEPHANFEAADGAGRSDREEPQVNGTDEGPPEWVSGTLPETPHARARASRARSSLYLEPSAKGQNLSPSARADEGVEAPKPKGPSRKAKPKEHPRFTEFWDAYGHKVERLAAVKAFTGAMDGGADPDELIAAAGRYARRCKRLGLDRHHIKHASGWLNGERWTDEIEDDAPEPGTGAQPPRHGQPDSSPAAGCCWCDAGMYERGDGRMAPCPHTDDPPPGHPAARHAGSTP